MMNRSRLRRLAGLGIRFLVVGGISTLIEIGVFNLFYLVLDWAPVWAKIVASLVALVNAYFGNREWAFRHRGGHGRTLELVLFLVVNGLCTLLGAAIVAGGVHLAQSGLDETPGPLLVNLVNLISIGLVVVVRFVLYHYVVFKGTRVRDERMDAEARLASAEHLNRF